jgi:hypothetical protein
MDSDEQAEQNFWRETGVQGNEAEFEARKRRELIENLARQDVRLLLKQKSGAAATKNGDLLKLLMENSFNVLKDKLDLHLSESDRLAYEEEFLKYYIELRDKK